MVRVSIAVSGGIWLSESFDSMAQYVRFHATGEVDKPNTAIREIRCEMGKRGFRGEGEPRFSLFCHHCGAVLIQKPSHPQC
jgi:hypothetical protein